MADVAPDGTVAYFGRDGEIWTMGLDGSAAASLGIETGGRSFSPRWSPDGSKLAVLRYDPRQHTTAHRRPASTPAWRCSTSSSSTLPRAT